MNRLVLSGLIEQMNVEDVPAHYRANLLTASLLNGKEA